ELLAPWHGHRYRVQRLMELAGGAAPRRGPRFAPPAHRSH
ncbi:MAG: DNA-3-methyladenine glycosylase 2 family protein, partial [Actinomycetota bacterium]|nr:DNA-3-methyladenine glycosylase 2 family protein [Actinomycetota bacterium]